MRDNKDPEVYFNTLASLGLVVADDRIGHVPLEEVEQPTPTNPTEKFCRCFAKMRLLKTVNWFLLLLLTCLTIFANVRGDFQLYWSRCWDILFGESFHNSGWNAQDRVALIPGALLAMAGVSMFLYLKARKAFAQNKPDQQLFFASLGVLELILAIIFALNMSFVGTMFGMRTFAEYHWFLPKIANQSTTLAELTEWARPVPWTPHIYYNNHGFSNTTMRPTTASPTTTPPPSIFEMRTMEERKRAIQTRLVLDPLITNIALLSLLLNVVFACRIRLAMKRSGLWTGPYNQLYPDCSTLDTAYAKWWPMGLLKALHWLLPTSIFFVSLYDGYHPNLNKLVLSGIIALGYLVNWLFYVQKVYFQQGDAEHKEASAAENPRRLDGICKMDWLLFLASIFAFVLFHFTFVYSHYQPMTLAGIVLFVGSFIYNNYLLFRPQTGYKGCIGLSAISVNITVNVIKNGEEANASLENNGTAKEKEQENQEEKPNLDVE